MALKWLVLPTPYVELETVVVMKLTWQGTSVGKLGARFLGSTTP